MIAKCRPTSRLAYVCTYISTLLLPRTIIVCQNQRMAVVPGISHFHDHLEILWVKTQAVLLLLLVIVAVVVVMFIYEDTHIYV